MKLGSELPIRLRGALQALLCGLVLLCAGATHAAPPLNDDFSKADPLTGDSGSASTSTLEATRETSEPLHAGVTGTGSVWWQWSTLTTSTATFDTFGSNFDTLLAVYVGSDLPSLTEIASSDDADSTSQSQVSFTAGAGTVYFIAVDGGNDQRGSALLNWQACVLPGTPADPLPADGQTTTCALAGLDWADASDAQSYDVYIDSVFVANVSSSDLTLSSPLSSGPHNWQVVALSGCESTTGPLWSFCLANSPAGPVPSDGETTSCALASLDWQDTCGAGTYDVYVDAVLVSSGLSSSDLALTVPLSSGPHTWQVVASGACGTTTSPLWSLCLFDSVSAAVAPGDGAVLSSPPSVLDWSDVCGATSYSLLLDGATVAVTTQSESAVSPALVGVGTHTWRVISEGECGGAVTGPAWLFEVSCPVPALPASPLPADASTTDCALAELDWEDSLNATEYRVLIDGAEVGVTSSSSFSISLPLISGPHDWQVIASSGCAETTGPVWNFCLLDRPLPNSPRSSETTDAATLLFDWAGACGAASYDLYIDDVLVTSVLSSDASVTTALAPGMHSWNVHALGQFCGQTTSERESFCIQGTPDLPVPADGETTACSLAVLDWSDVYGASSYDVYLDDVLLTSGLASSDLPLEGALPGGNHSWQVVANGPCGATTGTLWSFCLADSAAVAVAPADGAVLSSFPLVFDWTEICGATTYTLVVDNATVGVTTSTEFAVPAGLVGVGAHTWQVFSQGECGSAVEVPVWRFEVSCPVPAAPSGPVPADGGTTQCALAELDWDDAGDALEYRVLINGVEAGVTSSSRFVIPEPLGYGAHTWQVVASSGCAETSGSRWSFCLLDTPVLQQPAPGETTDCASIRFDWADACGAEFYELYIDDVLVTSVVTSECLITSAVAGGMHGWNVRAVGTACGEVDSERWSFCAQGTPTAPLPLDGETTGCALPKLDWEDACGATSYEVYVDSVLVDTVTSSELSLLVPLTPGAHTWQVLARGCGETSSTLWSFCLLDGASPVSPADDSFVSGTLDTLDWSDACGATTYTLVLDGVVTAVTTLSSHTFPDPLPPGTYVWQVIAENECGVAPGPQWTFYLGCEAVPVPSNPIPYDGETTDTSLSRLSWDPVPDTVSYLVYINDTLAATTSNTYMDITFPGYNTFTWYVIARTRDCGDKQGPVWNFRICDIPGVAALVTPAEGETTDPQNIFFDWEPAANSPQYLVMIDSSTFGSFTETQWQANFPVTPGPHTWTVVSQSGCEYTTSPARNFCAIPEIYVASPQSGSTFCVPPTVLDWNDVESATGYDVYLDGVLVSDNQPLSSYPINAVLTEGMHTWQVVAHNVCGSRAGDVWTFNIVTEAGPRSNMWVTNGSVYAMAVSGNVVYMGGSFSQVGPADGSGWVARQNLAAFDMSSGLALAWNPRADAAVRALTCDSGVVYVGGDFDRVGGVFRSRVAAVDEISGAVTGWNPGANGSVQALATDNTTVYAGGRFTSFGGSPRPYAAACDKATGALRTSWNPSPNSFVRSIAVTSSTVFLGGNFSTVGGQNRRGLAACDAGGALLPWDANVDLYVYTVVPYGNTLYVGGLFNSVNGQSRRNLAAIDVASAVALPWSPETNGAVNALAVAGDTVYAGGLFSTIGGFPRPYLSAVDRLTGVPPDCGFDPDYPVHCLTLTSDSMCVGGDFTYIGTASKRGFAAFGGTVPGSTVQEWKAYGEE